VKQGRLTVDTDRKVTLVRLRADSTTGDHDVLLTRFDFAPSGAEGAEYALRLGLDLGHARELSIGHAYRLGSEIPAFGTVTCFCRPLRPDSVRGTYVLRQRGVAQLTGRVDATLYFTAWDSSADHVTYRLRQSIFGVR